jgi:hypothetical protein
MGKTRRFNKKRAYKKRRTIRKQRKSRKSRKYHGGVEPVCDNVGLMPIDELKPSSMLGLGSMFGSMFGETKYIIFYDVNKDVILEGQIMNHTNAGIKINSESLSNTTTIKCPGNNLQGPYGIPELKGMEITHYKIVKKIKNGENCSISCT